MTNKARNIPLSLDHDLLAEIDAVAESKHDTRSGIMRQSISKGLPLVKSGGNADVITLDSELSAEMDQATTEIGLNRSKIILEAIRAGLQAFVTKKISEKLSLAEIKTPEEKEFILREIERSYTHYDDPFIRETRMLIFERGQALSRLSDLLDNVPEAKRRFDAVEKLAEIRRMPGGGGGGRPFGLSTELMEGYIKLAEKYGPKASDWPEEEKKALNEADSARKKLAVSPTTSSGKQGKSQK